MLTSAPVIILPSQYADLQVKFQQTTKGLYTGIIKMYTNDPVRPIYLVNLTGTAFAPNYLTIPALSTKNIDSLWVPVKVNNIEPFVGFQFDLEFPFFMQYLAGSGQLTTRSQDHMLTVQPVNSTKIRVLAYSITQSPFTGDTGAIVRLRFVVNSSNQSQTSANMNLSGAILGNAQMQNILYQLANSLLTLRYPHALSGTITYNNDANTPMDSVWISLHQNNVKLDSVRATIGGAFSFTGIYDGNYRITGRTNKPWGGVNGTDALKIQRHFAGLELLTIPIRLSGADVNNSGSINGTDALKVKRRFAGLDTNFTKPDWLFEKVTGSDTVIMGITNTSVSYYALCTGDVNGSNIPGQGAKSEQGTEVSNESSVSVSANQEVYLPITIDKDCDLGAFSMIIDFQGELADIRDVAFVGGQPLFSVRKNRLSIVWSELNGLKVNQYEPFAFIKLKTTSLFTADKVLNFTNASSLTEVADRSGTVVKGVRIMIPALTYYNDSSGSDIQIYPNPAVNRSFLFFNAREAGAATIRIYDILGRCVETIGPGSTAKGLNKIDLDLSRLKKNVYQMSFEFVGEDQSIKEVKTIIAGN